ncbi:MAG: metal-dependent transcriptional regulator [Lachnospiraceae bacterium]
MSYIKHRADESLEDYLETILLLQKNIGQVRSIDIANEMNFTKPSVSIAMKNLREKGYITMADTGYITLTEDGRQRAEDVLERHTILTDLLIHIGVSKETAMADACKIEHDLSEESFEAIKRALHSSKLLSDNRW